MHRSHRILSGDPVRLFPRAVLVVLGLLSTVSSRAHAAQVDDLTALHRDGQTFLTWRIPQVGPGWTFRVYESSTPFDSSTDLSSISPVATIGDSSWFDRRLSEIQNQTYAYCITPGGTPLSASQALFVSTPVADRSIYYAVTAQLGTEPEDRSVRPGATALVSPVVEHAAPPLPVFQRALYLGTIVANVYTLWTTHRDTPYFAAMGNRPSMPFDCSIVNGVAARPLWASMHHGGGSFITASYASVTPGDWVLGLDDYVYNERTWWYGYHEDYDANWGQRPPPTTGTVHDYTYQRVLYTTLWARRVFPVDTTRVYSAGASMGAIGAMMLALRRPDLIAGVLCVVGKIDFSYISDPNPAALFNPNNVFRFFCDRQWGTVAANLPSSDGMRVFESVNGGHRARLLEQQGLPPILMVNGRNDVIVGWGENIGFYDSMRVSRNGGRFFWDSRAHGGGYETWQPMQDPIYLRRFRLDRSFPAVSNCTVDDDPGNGNPATGDSVGCINGFVEWDTTLVDEPEEWQTTLTLRNLPILVGTIPAPDSARMDVTPRRLQRFAVAPGAGYAYQVNAVVGGQLLAQGTVYADNLGLVTVPQVLVPRTGARLHLEHISAGPPRERRIDLAKPIAREHPR